MVVQAGQVKAPPPELLTLNPDGSLKYPCPRAALPVVVVDPATGRPTTTAAESARFGVESDAFVGVCEGRVRLGAVALQTAADLAQQTEERLTRRTLWQRLTPWRD